jgi:hypothetical protein
MVDAVIDPDDPEVARSIREASARIEELLVELLAAHPMLRETLAVPGMFVGCGLGSFVGSGMTDNQIAAQVLSIVAQIRQGLASARAASA